MKRIGTAEIGEIGNKPGQEALIWRLMRNQIPTEEGTSLLYIALKAGLGVHVPHVKRPGMHQEYH